MTIVDREQYEQRVKTRNDLEAVRRQMAKLRTMVVNPTNKKFVPVEILHNKAFMDAVESIGENVLLNRRKDIAQKMNELVEEIRKMRGKGDEDFDDTFDAEYASELQGFVDWIKDDVQQEQADGTKAYKRQGLDAYEINQIIHSMGKFENEYMLTAEHYFNDVAKKAINETFMVTRHREIARSDYYIPVRVDSKFTKAEIQSLKFDFTIEGAGSYKHIMPHAPQPILIESLNTVIDRHIAQTGKLYGLDIPIINFKYLC